MVISIKTLIVYLFISSFFFISEKKDERYIFFLHNRFLEENDVHDEHPVYGQTQYHQIIHIFESYGFQVISEQREGNVNAREYAINVVQQIDHLISKNIPPEFITIVGTSKGGYIAQYVSTIADNPALNFVFIASFRENDMTEIPDINFCGNILTIYDKTDSFGVSAISRRNESTCHIANFKEVEINTGLGHGFLFKPLDEWVVPVIKWANGNYELQ